MSVLGVVLGSLTLLLGGASSVSAAPSFTGLGVFFRSGESIGATGVSADGSVVVGSVIPHPGSSRRRQAFRWTESGGMVGLGALPGAYGVQSGASAVSADGSVVVGGSNSDSGRYEAFRWTESGGMVGLGRLPGDDDSGASAISADGSVVVGSSRSYSSPGPSDAEAFRWTEAGGMVGLGPGFASGISADGSVVVGKSRTDSGSEAFRWTEEGGIVGLGYLSARDYSYSVARAISADGSVVVGQSSTDSGSSEAFRWTESGGMVGLGEVPGGNFNSYADAVSADGSVVVGGVNSLSGNKAFVWDEENGMRTVKQMLIDQGIDMTGWDLEVATGISDDGLTIVGAGYNPSGFQEAWIATIPEPGTALLLGIGLAGMSLRRATNQLC